MSLHNMLSAERLAEIQAIHDRCGGWNSRDEAWQGIPQVERNAWFLATGQKTRKEKANQRRAKAQRNQEKAMQKALADMRDEAVKAGSIDADLAR